MALVLHIRQLKPLDDPGTSKAISTIKHLDMAYDIPAGGTSHDVGLDAEPFNGRSGFLQALLLLRHELENSHTVEEKLVLQLEPFVNDSSLSKKQDIIVASGRAGAAAFPVKVASTRQLPLVWRWGSSPKKIYLGAAHGICEFLPHQPVDVSSTASRWDPLRVVHAPAANSRETRPRFAPAAGLSR